MFSKSLPTNQEILQSYRDTRIATCKWIIKTNKFGKKVLALLGFVSLSGLVIGLSRVSEKSFSSIGATLGTLTAMLLMVVGIIASIFFFRECNKQIEESKAQLTEIK